MSSKSLPVQPTALLVVIFAICASLGATESYASSVRKGQLEMSRAEYVDRAKAIWMAQMIGQLTGLEFEDEPASVLKNTPFVHGKGFAETDDDYYYEMVAIRAFEKYGIDLTVQQLGA